VGVPFYLDVPAQARFDIKYSQVTECLAPTNSFKLQGLSKKKWLMNWFMGKAEKKIAIQHVLTDMIASKEAQGKLHGKWFLLKTILF